MKELNINKNIRAKDVRVIFGDTNLGIIPTKKAQAIALSNGLDLVEISPNTNPPVCKILDYGKYKYEKSKNEIKKITEKIHEIKFGINIDKNDFKVKLNKIKNFLNGGDKVKITITFKGRQLEHTDIGYALGNTILSELGEDVKHTKINLSGKNIIFFVNR